MFAKVTALVAMLTVFCVGWAFGIVIDGVNDFPPEARIDVDVGDTQFPEIDLGDVYVAHDENAIYIGYGHDPGTWTTIQIGIAVMFPGVAGGTTDPWGHQIGFQGACLPKFIAYMNIDTDYNEWIEWEGGAWQGVAVPGGLNWVIDTPFDEVELTYDRLGVDCEIFSQVFIEIWVTQEGGTKGPLDLSYNDDLQLSTPGGTTWDIESPVLISCYHCIELYGPSASEATTWSGIKRLYR